MKWPQVLVSRQLPVVVTAVILVMLYVAAGLLYDGFFSPRVLTNLLADNAFLGIAALGMTLVIFTGGIDLSVGAVIGFTAVLVSSLITNHNWPPLAAWSAGVGAGATLGLTMGWLIEHFKLPAFLVTLAGMFFARGLAFQVTTESIGIQHSFYHTLSEIYIPFGEARLTAPALTLIVMALALYGLAHHTRFGRNLLAIGGNTQSATLMGLPVRHATIAVYGLNGFCAAVAGIVASLYTGSGNPSMGIGLELDAIAVVVIGGTVLTGGRGHVAGSVLGLLIFGVIQTAILFDGRLSSWWMRIVVGLLLLAFILLQRLLLSRPAKP
jgi:ribose/xylose/arabinose/galactoside ABC-type transport system permease subunit